MGISHGTIAFRQDRCDSCNDCISACARAKSGSDDAVHSRIQIMPGTSDGSFELALCRQCGEPKCVMNCPSGALTKDHDSGVIPWDQEKCIDCLLCTVGCAYAGITYNAEIGHVIKCDMCDGDPACVKACPQGALEHSTINRFYNDYGAR